MIAPGEQGIWDFGPALVVVTVDPAGLRVEVGVVDRGWEGEERQERHVLEPAPDGWRATPPVDGRETAPDWRDLLPGICHMAPPTEIVRAGPDHSAAF